jgi:hypothetical protein
MSDQLMGSGRSLLDRLAEFESRIRALEGAQQSGILGTDQTIKGGHDRLDALLGAGVASPDGTLVANFNADLVDGRHVMAAFTPLTVPLTSISFDGDAFSDVGTPTLIDLSAAFGAPAGIKAALLRVQARDSASATVSGLHFSVLPSTNADAWCVSARPSPAANDTWVSDTGICPCDTNGDIYYICDASGTGTLDVVIIILGYWI